MSKKTKAEKPETIKKATKAKPAAKPKKPREPKAAPAGFDFVGRVESIRVTGGAAGAGFEFALHGRKGARQSYRLGTEHGAAMIAMAHIVIAAHDKDAKIGVRSEKAGNGLPVAAEVVWRPKLGKAG